MKELLTKITPAINNTIGLTKKSLKEKILMIKIVEKGNEQANIFTPKSMSKLGFCCSSFSSIALTALMCANGQKLQALCGKTTNNRIMEAPRAGNKKTKNADNTKVIPARLIKREKIRPNSLNFIRTAIPIKRSTNGVIIKLIFVMVFPKKLGKELRVIPKPNKTRAIIITKLIGSFSIEIKRPFNLLDVVATKSLTDLA